MRTIILAAGLAIGLADAAILPARPAQSSAIQADDDARIVASFEGRVRHYVDLHRRLEVTVPAPAISDDWSQIRGAIEALAGTIRGARRDARQGDIFTPEIARWFRQQVARYLEGRDIDDLVAELSAENPPNVVFVPRINTPWPARASYGPMPPRLLAALPPLPEELQYRFLDRDLVLLDAHANVIVDFVERALSCTVAG
jgi:hypothetical protein